MGGLYTAELALRHKLTITKSLSIAAPLTVYYVQYMVCCGVSESVIWYVQYTLYNLYIFLWVSNISNIYLI